MNTPTGPKMCTYCDAPAYKTNGYAQPICQRLAETGHCKGRKHPGPVQARALHVPGRNAPCPCGSGKKYKRCCIGKPRAQKKSLKINEKK